ncbi:MAG: hypothetical protein QM589_17440 [Thermomicrobiales bacterium]
MTEQPRHWLDRLVGACLSIFLGALALYGAVMLVLSIWQWLVLVLIIIAICVAVWLRRSRSPW